MAAKFASSKKSKAVKPSRVGLKQINCYQPPETWRQLKILAAEQEKTMEGLMGEALNLLFARYQKPPIAKS
ncbi:MAG: ribbon-helix-helix domain-containing protein [Steroidobacteraceae bacterium]